MSQTPFRSVGQQRRTESTNVRRSAPDRSQQTKELARQQALQRDNLRTVIDIDQKLQLANTQVLSDSELRNQQLIMAQMSDNLELSQKARELRQAQGLTDQRMLDEFDRQIIQLRNAEKVTAADIKNQQASNNLNSITSFGESFLRFSKALTDKNIEEQNLANRQLQAKGKLDALMQRAGNPEAELTQAQDTRAAIGTNLSVNANELERQGLENDATQLRSNNAFYRFGFQEGLVLKAANGFDGALKQAVDDFVKNNQIYGQKDALVKVQQFIRNFSVDYIDKNGLQALPDEILNAYFTRPMLVAQTKTVGSFNTTNNKVTKDLAVGTGINKLLTYVNSVDDVSVDPTQFQNTVSKEALALIALDPANAQANLERLYNAIYNETRYSEDPAKANSVVRFIDALKSDPNLLPYVDPIVNKFNQDEYNREQRIETAAEKAEKESADAFIDNLNSQAQNITTAQGITELKQQALLSPEFINAPPDQKNRMRDQILNLGVRDSAAIQLAVAEFEATNPTAEEREQYAKDNLGYGSEFVEDQLAKAKVQRQVIAQHKNTLTSYQAQVSSTIPPLATNKTRGFGADAKYKDLVKQRKAELALRFSNWFQSQPDIPDDKQVKEWFERQQDLYAPVQESDLDAQLGNQGDGSGTSIQGSAGAPKVAVAGGKSAFNYTEPGTRQRAASGSLGTLDPTEGVFLTQSEVIALTRQYEEDGTVAPLLQDLVDNSNVTVEEFLEGQANLFGMGGSVVKPGTQFRGVWNETTSVRTYYSNKGYSKNASIAFQSIYTFFGKGKDVVFLLDNNAEQVYKTFAKDNNLNAKDPNTRMEFLDVIVRRNQGLPNGGNKIFQVLNSANPTVDELVDAMAKLFGLNAVNKEAFRNQLSQSL
tara:strand:+ start:1088 stop:3727 length:2640 start_codon:yes stop_codon:yes gene_type:complete